MNQHAQSFEVGDLLKVVSHRENIVTVYLMAIVAAVVVPKFVTSPQTILGLQGLIWLCTGSAFYLMAAAMKERNAWWAFVAAFIPLANLFMVCRLRSKATSILREHSVHISKAFDMRNQIKKMAATGVPVLLMLLACASLFSADTAKTDIACHVLARIKPCALAACPKVPRA